MSRRIRFPASVFIVVVTVAVLLSLGTLALAHAHGPHGLASPCPTCQAVRQAHGALTGGPPVSFWSTWQPAVPTAASPVGSACGPPCRSRAPPSALGDASR